MVCIELSFRIKLGFFIRKKKEKKITESKINGSTYNKSGIRFKSEIYETYEDRKGDKFESIHTLLDSEAWEDYSDEDDDKSENDCCNYDDLHYACVDVTKGKFIMNLNEYEEPTPYNVKYNSDYSYWSLDDDRLMVESTRETYEEEFARQLPITLCTQV